MQTNLYYFVACQFDEYNSNCCHSQLQPTIVLIKISPTRARRFSNNLKFTIPKYDKIQEE